MNLNLSLHLVLEMQMNIVWNHESNISQHIQHKHHHHLGKIMAERATVANLLTQ